MCWDFKSCVVCSRIKNFNHYLHTDLSVDLQGCVPGKAPWDAAAVCHEEDQPAELDPEEPDPAGVCGAGHSDVCRESFCGQHVLLLWDKTALVHGHGVCGGWVRRVMRCCKCVSWSNLMTHTHTQASFLMCTIWVCFRNVLIWNYLCRWRLCKFIKEYGSLASGHDQNVLCRDSSGTRVSS